VADPELQQRRREVEAARESGRPRAPIGESWTRCREVVDAAADAAPVDVDESEVLERWASSAIRRADVGLEEQLTQAAELGDLVAAVTDADGRILWSAGGRSMRRDAERVGFVPGGRWDEASAGTNALGLALRTGRPASVFSAEHWCDVVRDWVCWSAPVLDADGRSLGVIDLSGDGTPPRRSPRSRSPA
jgi:transcriptional regulator of acetoin/glycerol metabolism